MYNEKSMRAPNRNTQARLRQRRQQDPCRHPCTYVIPRLGRRCRNPASCRVGCVARCHRHSKNYRAKGICRARRDCDARFAGVIGDGVVIRQSQISRAGNGLFVTRRVLRGDAITEYDGNVITSDEARRMREDDRDRASHMRKIVDGSSLVIDGLRSADVTPGRGGGSFANDARDTDFAYNAAFCTTTRVVREVPDRRGGVRALGRVWLVATRQIDPGEEVFVNYGAHYWRR